MKKKLLLLLSLVALAVWAEHPDKMFTEMETNHIRVKTPGLIAESNRFLIRLPEWGGKEFCYPLPGAKVISPYGGPRAHAGADIKTKANDTIRCVFNGVVRMSKDYAAYGKVIVVRHENGLESVYSHNSKNFVKSGEYVKAGQAIALTGRTGRATTEHLHFEFRINGQHINPGLVLDLTERTLREDTLLCTKSGDKIKVEKFTESK
jgi:murein DD-endopeptidase MepM/ murein hydrolase activator NlpD